MLQRDESPLMEDIPNLYVCCHCGYVSIGLPPDLCPTCEARPYSFKEIPPIFFLQQPLEASEVDALLHENLRDIEKSVGGVDEATADNGVWPMRAILAHLLGAQLIMFNRAQRMLTEDRPDLGSIPRSAIDAIYGEASRPIEEMLESYRTTRHELLNWIHALSEEQLARPGIHPEWGRFTVLSQVAYIVRHEQLHLAELRARREGR